MRGTHSTHVVLLLVIPYVGMLSSAVLIPVLPKIADTLNIPFAQTTWLITTLSIAAGITVPIAGYLSDRWTRTSVLAPSLILYGLGGLLGGVAPLFLADPFGMLIVARVLQGIGSAGTSVQAIALAGDIFQSKQRSQVLGMMETSNAVGKATGPLMGAGLATIAWFAPFFLFPVMAIPIALLLWWSLGRLPDAQGDSFARYNREFWDAVRHKLVPLGLTFLTGFLGVNVILLLLTLLSRELAEAEIRGIMRGVFVTLPEVVVAITAFAAGRYLRDDYMKRSHLVTVVGLTLLVLALGGAAFSVSVWFFFGAVMVAGAGSGAVLATMNTLVADSVPEKERGFVTALYGGFRSLGVAVLPFFFVLRTVLGSEAIVFWLMGAAVILAAGAVALYMLPERLHA